MIHSLSKRVLFGVLLIVTGTGVLAGLSDPNLVLQSRRLVERIRDYHAGAPENGETLRIVYFIPADANLPADYHPRILRIVNDIRDFYLGQMKRNGFVDSVMPLETEDGKLKIQVVQGQKPTSAYSYEYKDGKVIQQEIEKALAGQISFDNDFVLIICNLCTLRADGSYFFNSPYYGGPGSDIRRGYCFVADCPMQDPLLLTDTKSKIVYEEHYGSYTKTLAQFNTTYLGGIAHELGHGLGLHHMSQADYEKKTLGTSLMGSGNHTYRREIWSPDKKGSFLTFASCLQLAVHPLFTQSNLGRDLKPELSITELRFSSAGQELKIEGTVTAAPEALALIAYCDPEEQDNDTEAWTDYDAVTWTGEVCDGKFSVVAGEHKKSYYKLRLSLCHINGAFSTVKLRYQADASGCPDAAGLNARWNLQNAQLALMNGQKDSARKIAKKAIMESPGCPEAARFAHLLNLVDANEPADLDSVTADTVSLSDVRWLAAEVGWGKPARNSYYFDAQIQDALFLEPGGVFHAKGLYAHAPSRYLFSLKGKWKRLEAKAGLQKDVPKSGSAIFIIKGDGKNLYQSDLIKGDTVKEVCVSLEGIDRLELITENGKEGNACCWSLWGSPMIFR